MTVPEGRGPDEPSSRIRPPAVPAEGGAEVVVLVDDALPRAGPNEVTVHRLAG